MSEVVISSVIIYCKNEEQSEIENRLQIIEELSFFPEFSRDGKVVAVLEAATTSATEIVLSKIEKLPGVLSVRMVYNHVDSEQAMSEEIS